MEEDIIRCHYNVVKYSMILHTPVRYAEVDHKSKFKLTKYIEYLHFVGKLQWKLFRKLTKSSALVLDINSLWPTDITWRHRSVSTLARVKACCLTAPSHYLNQCWPLFSEILAHSPERNFAVSKLLFCIMCWKLFLNISTTSQQPKSWNNVLHNFSQAT